MTKRQALTRVLTPVAVIGIGIAVSVAAGSAETPRAIAKQGAPTTLKDHGAVENLLAPTADAAGNAAPTAEEDSLAAPAQPVTVAYAVDEPRTERLELVLGRGDTLVETMTGAGVTNGEAHYATRALQRVINLRRLQAGQSVALVFELRAGERHFLGAEITRRDGGYAVVAREEEDRFRAFKTDDPAALGLTGFGAAEPAAAIVAEEVADPADQPAMEMAAVAESSDTDLKIDRVDLTLGPGDTLAGLMTSAGVSATEAHYAVRALQRVENPRRMQPGQDIALVFERQGNDRTFLGLQLERRNGRYAIVTRDGDDGFQASPVSDLASLTQEGFGPAMAEGPALEPVLIEQVLPSLAVVPASTEDGDLTRTAMLLPSADDSAHEERYLDFLSLHIEQVERTVGRGDTLAGLMADAGVDRLVAHNAIQSLGDVFNPRRLRAGQVVSLTFENRGERRDFAGLELSPDIETRIVVARGEDGEFVTESITNQFETRMTAAAGTIESSLYAASNGAGVPDPVLIAVIRAYSFEVDFQRDIRPGDGFELLFEQDFDEDGALARNGNVLYANLRVRGNDTPMYRFESEDGTIDYYDRDGQSVRRTLMRTPIDGARISSRYGMRRHPILGYSRMHRGTDFAAPTGTPIYAAGAGTIESLGRNGGYGRYIRIRHVGSLKTAYAHMSRYARGLGRGSRVQQGQIIGYVGTSGRSTGPHLHYEVLMEGRQVNPMTLDLPSGRTLEGEELEAFQQIVALRDQQYAEAMIDVQVARSPED